MFESVNIIGIPVAATSPEQAVTRLRQYLSANSSSAYITVTGVHGIIESHFNQQTRAAHLNALACLPDGMPLSWFGWLKGHRDMDRVYGPDLMLATLEVCEQEGFRSFFYGGHEGVPEKLSETLKAKLPKLKIAGTFSPPFRPLQEGEESAIIDSINKTHPDIVWIGLSTPKQELLMNKWKGRIKAPLMIGVGAAFDFLSGGKKQAPKWIQRSGLEWFFRLCSEPQRLWKRYFFIVPAFLILAFLQLTGLRKFDKAKSL